jgi:hypothetical protein
MATLIWNVLHAAQDCHRAHELDERTSSLIERTCAPMALRAMTERTSDAPKKNEDFGQHLENKSTGSSLNCPN